MLDLNLLTWPLRFFKGQQLFKTNIEKFFKTGSQIVKFTNGFASAIQHTIESWKENVTKLNINLLDFPLYTVHRDQFLNPHMQQTDGNHPSTNTFLP